MMAKTKLETLFWFILPVFDVEQVVYLVRMAFMTVAIVSLEHFDWAFNHLLYWDSTGGWTVSEMT